MPTPVTPLGCPEDVWLAARRTGLGGSDAVTLMGAGQYDDETPFFVWLAKTEGYDVPTNLAMQRGHDLEPLVADRYAADTGQTLVEVGMFAHDDHPIMLGSPDRLIADKDGGWIGGFEAKTTLSRTADKWDGELPRRFEWQVRQYMAVLDLPWFDVRCLVVDTWETLSWRVYRDANKERALVAACVGFWSTYVEPGIAPEPEAVMTLVEVSARWPSEEEPALELDPDSREGREVSDLLEERVTLDRVAKGAKERLAAIDTSLKAVAAERGEVRIGGQRAYTWREYSRRTVDAKRLRAEWPDVAAQCERDTPYRTLRVG